jgi:hypothetical protein
MKLMSVPAANRAEYSRTRDFRCELVKPIDHQQLEASTAVFVDGSGNSSYKHALVSQLKDNSQMHRKFLEDSIVASKSGAPGAGLSRTGSFCVSQQ